MRKIIDDLQKLDKSYFGKDRHKQLKGAIDEAVALLDSKPIDLVQNKKAKAELLFLRGKVLCFLPEYTRQAEE